MKNRGGKPFTRNIYIYLPVGAVLFLLVYEFKLKLLFGDFLSKLFGRHFSNMNYPGLVITFLCLFWGAYEIKKLNLIDSATVYKKMYHFVQRYAVFFLLFYIVVVIIWFGFVLFTNPYSNIYNQGDASYFTQLLHNMVKGIGPEMTTHLRVNIWLHKNPYWFASIFSVGQYWLPYMLLTPLYALHPYPPMHVFSVVMVVIVFGSIGVYLAVQAMGGTKMLALLGAMGYVMLPQVEYAIFLKGHFDNLGYAVLPYVFAAIFAERWGFFLFFIFLLSMINISYTYIAICIGIVVAIFYRARIPGTIACIIGFLVLQFDWAVLKQSLIGVWLDTAPIPSNFKILVLDKIMKDFKSLIYRAVFSIIYFLVFLANVSFLPVYGIKSGGKWNWKVIGLIVLAIIGSVLGWLREYGWLFQRSSTIIVPLYLSVFLVYAGLKTSIEENTSNYSRKKDVLTIVGALLISAILTMTLWTTRVYPWVGLSPYAKAKGISITTILRPDNDNIRNASILKTINHYVPEDASIAINIDPALQAFLSNRQKVWWIGFNPAGVEYYIIQQADFPANPPTAWRERIKELEKNPSFRLLCNNDGVTIYKNMNPHPIPRVDSITGWDVVFRIFS